VVFLTARDATDDKIRGLTLGGDDYVTKPFSLEALTARIRAGCAPGPRRAEPHVVQSVLRRLELDEESHEVRRVARWCLVADRFKLLRYLMRNAGRVLSKAQILDHVWQYDFRGDDRHRGSPNISVPAPQGGYRRAAPDPHLARRGVTCWPARVKRRDPASIPLRTKVRNAGLVTLALRGHRRGHTFACAATCSIRWTPSIQLSGAWPTGHCRATGKLAESQMPYVFW